MCFDEAFLKTCFDKHIAGLGLYGGREFNLLQGKFSGEISTTPGVLLDFLFGEEIVTNSPILLDDEEPGYRYLSVEVAELWLNFVPMLLEVSSRFATSHHAKGASGNCVIFILGF